MFGTRRQVPTPAAAQPHIQMTSATNSPFIDATCENWTRRLIARSLWRFHGEYEADDLLSEAWLVLDRISAKYGDVAVNHLMSLYKISFVHHLHRLADKSKKADITDSIYADEANDEYISEPAAHKSILETIIDAPDDVREGITAFLTADPSAVSNQHWPCGRRMSYDNIAGKILGRKQSTCTVATEMRQHLRNANDPLD